MKIRVESKEKGYEYKKKIEKVISEEGWISLSEVCGIIPGVDSLTDNNIFYGWDDEIRLLRKIRVRQTKEGWWLYLPEPNYVDEPEEKNGFEEAWEKVFGSEFDSVKNLLLAGVYGRPCKVISKTKKKTKEEPGFCHGKSDLKFTKSDGTEMAYPIFVVEMTDGSIRQVKPENIVFTDREVK